MREKDGGGRRSPEQWAARDGPPVAGAVGGEGRGCRSSEHTSPACVRRGLGGGEERVQQASSIDSLIQAGTAAYPCCVTRERRKRATSNCERSVTLAAGWDSWFARVSGQARAHDEPSPSH